MRSGGVDGLRSAGALGLAAQVSEMHPIAQVNKAADRAANWPSCCPGRTATSSGRDYNRLRGALNIDPRIARECLRKGVHVIGIEYAGVHPIRDRGTLDPNLLPAIAIELCGDEFEGLLTEHQPSFLPSDCVRHIRGGAHAHLALMGDLRFLARVYDPAGRSRELRNGTQGFGAGGRGERRRGGGRLDIDPSLDDGDAGPLRTFVDIELGADPLDHRIVGIDAKRPARIVLDPEQCLAVQEPHLAGVRGEMDRGSRVSIEMYQRTVL